MNKLCGWILFFSGYLGIDQGACEAKSCCWQSSSNQVVVRLRQLLKFFSFLCISSSFHFFSPIACLCQPWCFTQQASVSACFGHQSSLEQPFSSAEVTTMRNLFLQNINIQGKGGVVASTQRDHVPDYYCEFDSVLSQFWCFSFKLSCLQVLRLLMIYFKYYFSQHAMNDMSHS